MRFANEEEFKKFYFGLSDPAEQIRELAKWRKFQSEIVSTFIDQIKLVANDQYTEIDHFILELLQNADDNEYIDGTSPTVWIELHEDRLILKNNEVGFSDKNVFAVTYAAASTKTREKTASTYIGEKGIGFKSVFAVAETIDIHSGSFDFQLRNDEFIIPHLLIPKNHRGTHIELKFRQSKTDIASVLSGRLAQVAEGSQQFLLFLQKLERLEIDNRLTGIKTVIEALRDEQAGYYLIQQDGKAQSLLKIASEKLIPAETVQTRYEAVKEDLPRETVLAVPMPEAGAPPLLTGLLFCYLPTRIKTGLPIHIQVDGKTTTNRENLQEFGSSEWNRLLFAGMDDDLVKAYRQMAGLDALRTCLPAYWPDFDEPVASGNRDFDELLTRFAEKLSNEAVVLDRHGQFRKPTDVRLVPQAWSQWLAEEKYEVALSTDDQAIAFVDPAWAKNYRAQVKGIGVPELTVAEIVTALSAGAPAALKHESEDEIRQFLSQLMDAVKYRTDLQAKLGKCEIFPVRKADENLWATASKKLFVTHSDSPKIDIGRNISVVDPRFTYSPGGRSSSTEEGRALREFNSKFRRFLEDDLELPVFSDVELLKQTVIAELKACRKLDIAEIEARKRVTDLWRQAYTRIWRRRKTIIKNTSEEEWAKLLEELKKCPISTRAGGKGKWKLGVVELSFLAKPFVPDSPVEQIYGATEAPIIKLEILAGRGRKGRKKGKANTGVNWEEWAGFLRELDAEEGPYFVDEKLPAWEHSGQEHVGEVNDEFPLLKAAIDSAVMQNEEFSGNSYWLTGHTTVSLDQYSLEALASGSGHTYIGKKLSQRWRELEGFSSEIRFKWGYKQNSRVTHCKPVLVHDLVRSSLSYESSHGLVRPGDGFIRTDFNTLVLGHDAPLIECGDDGYSAEFLRSAGINGDVSIESLSGYIDKQISTWDGAAEPSDLAAFLAIIGRYLDQRPEHRQHALVSIHLPHPVTGVAFPLQEWLDELSESSSESVIQLRMHFSANSAADAEELVSALFNLGDLAERSGEVCRLLCQLGRQITDANRSSILHGFETRLTDTGLLYAGAEVKESGDLPFIWHQRHQSSGDAEGVIFVTPGKDSEDLVNALTLLDWPSLATTRVQLKGDKADLLAVEQAARIGAAVNKICTDSSGTNPEVGARIRRLSIFRTSKDILANIRPRKGLAVTFTARGVSKRILVSYWYDDNALYVEAGVEVVDTLPLFLDDTVGATTSPFFRYVWNDPRLDDYALESADAGTPPAHPNPRDQEGDGDGGEEDAGSIFDDDLDEEKDQDQEGDDGKDNAKKPGGTRKRLCSIVLKKGEKKSYLTPKESTAQKEKIDKIEAKSRERMLEYFEGQGASVVSKETEKVGYDFEVSVGDKTIYVELKGSEYVWRDWEEALTAPEFKKALELGEDYYLCVVDQVFSEDSQMYFIQDPANMVDVFAFDHPWKQFSMDMESMMFRLKIQAGKIEE